MLSPAALDEAVRRGVLAAPQRDALLAIEAELQAPATSAGTGIDRASAGPRDPENLRFVGGFADVFVTIGIGLFLAGLGFVLASAGVGTTGIAAAIAAASWGLSEYFARARRMALPSIALLVAFVAACATALFGLLGGAGSGFLALFDLDTPGAVIAATTGTAALAALHYWRFRVPIAVGAAAAALVGLALSASYLAAPLWTLQNIRWLALGAGLLVFLAAMRFDLSDPARVTRRTDIAFWLHLVAAPLIVRASLPVSGGGAAGLFLPGAGVERGDALPVLGLFLLLALVSLVIDRRALLVSGLSFAGYAFWQVLSGLGVADQAVPVTLLALGGFILLLSAGWQPLRRLLLRLLPERLVRRLPRTAGG